MNLEDIAEALKSFVNATRSQSFAMIKEMRDMKQQLSYLDINITPSICCKSNKEQSARFMRLNEALRFKFSHEIEKAAVQLPAEFADSSEQQQGFRFEWGINKVFNYFCLFFSYHKIYVNALICYTYI